MQKQQDDMKNSMLSQLLDQDARARLNTVTGLSFMDVPRFNLLILFSA